MMLQSSTILQLFMGFSSIGSNPEDFKLIADSIQHVVDDFSDEHLNMMFEQFSYLSEHYEGFEYARIALRDEITNR